MPDEISIRTAEEKDDHSLARIYGHYVRHSTATFELEAPDEFEMERRRLIVAGAGLPYLVAEQNGAILGFAYAGPYRARPAYRYTVENSIYLDPAMRGKGVGSLLLARLIEDCTRAGKRQMVAVVGDSANTASVRLHVRLGFREVGVLRSVGRKFDRWLDTVLLQRELLHSGGEGV
ncbi:MAG: N-acetyltransferase family protein [Acidobacteriota bacterium]